ncbi:FliO/MopB family protein [Asticcacaulis solisilvae]|uniref:FliO/MopB family protein n=1 Tax=Asticcacaulis solisilvae TaxID=1217274 RepID=UPI003FD8D54F
MEALTSTLKAVFALAFVLGLILALAYVLKRYAPQLMAKMSAKRGLRRLEVVETLVLDPARRLVLVRLDDEERLILLGEGHELIEPRPKHTEIKPEPKPEPKTEPRAVEAPAVLPQAKPMPRPVPPAAPAKPVAASTPAKPAPAPAARPSVAQAQDPNDDLF